MNDVLTVNLTVNGQVISRNLPARTTLLDFLRDQAELTGTHAGCEMGACGACLVMLDGRPVHACLMLAAQAEGRQIQTVEGLAESGSIADLQEAFLARNALQCGFCTAGILVTAQALLSSDKHLNREEVRDALSGNYCRCTGYEAIVDAIMATADARAKVSTAQRELVPAP